MKYSGVELATVQAGVVIPGLQAVITGGLVGGVTAAVASLLGGDAFTWGLLTGGATSLASWFSGVTDWRAAVLQAGQGDQVQAVASDTVRLEVIGATDGAYPWGVFRDLRLSRDALSWALGWLADGGDLSMSAMVGPGRLSRSEFTAIRSALMAAGLAAWANNRAHSQGCVMLAAGRAAARRWIGAAVETSSLLPARVTGPSF